MSAQQAIARAVVEADRRRRAALEAALLEHDEVVEVLPWGGRVVYTAPAWRRHPLRRFRLERLRRAAR